MVSRVPRPIFTDIPKTKDCSEMDVFYVRCNEVERRGGKEKGRRKKKLWSLTPPPVTKPPTPTTDALPPTAVTP